MNVVIIDDEKIAIDVLKIIMTGITSIPLCIKGTFTNVQDAYPLFAQEQIDVVFLDIEMIDLHGLDVAQQLLAKYPAMQIVFVTAHAQFAVDAFEIEATDYLLKPIREERLVKALTKAQHNIQQRASVTEQPIPALYAHVLGSFRLVDHQQQVVKWRTKKVKELLLYLWMHAHKPSLNTVILEALWPEVELEKANAHLHTTVYQLRKLLKQYGYESPIALVNNHYQLQCTIASDYSELIQLLDEEPLQERTIERLLACYEGDFLAEEQYDWAISQQLYLRQRVLQKLELYVEQATNDLLLLQCLRKMLALDEFNEQYMYKQLQFFVAHNRKPDCIQCYAMIEHKLQRELGIAIPESIQQLYNQVFITKNNQNNRSITLY